MVLNFFLVVGVYNVITPFKFGDDQFRGFWLAAGQSLPFPTYFEVVLTNSHYRVRCDSTVPASASGTVTRESN